MAGEIRQLTFAVGVSVTAPTTAFQSYEETDAVNWDGATSTVTYDVSASVSDARSMIWVLQDGNNDRQPLQGADIDFPSATQVRVTFGLNIPSGTYYLLGVGAG